MKALHPATAGCRWRLSLADAVVLRALAASENMAPGDWCGRVLHRAVCLAAEKPTPPDGMVPRPPENDIRSFLVPMGKCFRERNPPAAAQVREMLEAWEGYRSGRLVPFWLSLK